MTPDMLVGMTGCRADVAQDYAPHISAACEKYDIVEPKCVAAFVAQMAHESRLFTQLEENLWYTTEARLIAVWPSRFRLPEHGEREDMQYSDGLRNPSFYVRQPSKLAEFVYGGRLGNGPEGSGDGWKYRGRGLKQLTGRRNYELYEDTIRMGVDQRPWLLMYAKYAADSAGWFWNMISGNRMVDDFDRLSALISGGKTGITDRRRLFDMALSVLA